MLDININRDIEILKISGKIPRLNLKMPYIAIIWEDTATKSPTGKGAFIIFVTKTVWKGHTGSLNKKPNKKLEKTNIWNQNG